MDLNRAILIVDDEPTVLMSLRMQLRSSLGTGYRYQTAFSAAEALEVFEALTDDGVRVILVITDWLMPGMKGDEFVRRVRSAHPDQERVQDLVSSGALDGFLKKPWDRERLVAECRRLLDGVA